MASLTPDATGPFCYPPLDPGSKQIRLLQLHQLDRHEGARPGDVKDYDAACISGILEVFEIGKCPPFRALSYEWGLGSKKYSIIINGGLHKVWENLWYFLCCYLKTFKSSTLSGRIQNSYLWIDQICLYTHRSSIKPLSFLRGFMLECLACRIRKYCTPRFQKEPLPPILSNDSTFASPCLSMCRYVQGCVAEAA